MRSMVFEDERNKKMALSGEQQDWGGAGSLRAGWLGVKRELLESPGCIQNSGWRTTQQREEAEAQ